MPTQDLTAGDDTFPVINVVDADIVNAGDGTDTLDLTGIVLAPGERILVDLDAVNQGNFTPGVASTQSGVVRILAEDGTVLRTLEVNDFENIIGSDNSETLFGNNETNVIEGRGGDDRIHPFGGVDTVDGGRGSDTLLLNAAGGNVTIDLENQVAGPNTLISIENADGGAFDDTITGDDGANVLNGNGGNDVINGQGGQDTIGLGAGADTVAFDATAIGEAPDQIADFDLDEDVFQLD
ncbi:MAG: calcium-binding protein, partial [Alphaproteobacteria bacterium]